MKIKYKSINNNSGVGMREYCVFKEFDNKNFFCEIKERFIIIKKKAGCFSKKEDESVVFIVTYGNLISFEY